MKPSSSYAQDEQGVWWYSPPSMKVRGQREVAIELLCEQCGERFLTRTAQPQVLCSRRCSDAARSTYPAAGPDFSGKVPSVRFQQDADGQWWYIGSGQHPRSRAKVATCLHCGTDFLLYSGQAKHSKGFCSKSCAYRASPRYKNGRVMKANGYVKLRVTDHPRADISGYVAEHRLVMERILGRYLEPHEQVHHINAVRDDNRPENLELWHGSHPSGSRSTDVKHCPSCTCGAQVG